MTAMPPENAPPVVRGPSGGSPGTIAPSVVPTLHAGATLAFWAAIGQVVVGLLTVLIAMGAAASAAAQGQQGTAGGGGALMVLLTLVALGLAAMAAYGWWQLTAVDAANPPTEAKLAGLPSWRWWRCRCSG